MKEGDTVEWTEADEAEWQRLKAKRRATVVERTKARQKVYMARYNAQPERKAAHAAHNRTRYAEMRRLAKLAREAGLG